MCNSFGDWLLLSLTIKYITTSSAVPITIEVGKRCSMHKNYISFTSNFRVSVADLAQQRRAAVRIGNKGAHKGVHNWFRVLCCNVQR